MIQDNQAFRRWAGTDAEPACGVHICDHDWSQPGPHLLEVFHGTTHEFQAFTLKNATHAAQFGKVHYFTSCSWDAAANYASDEGPDLKNRIAQRVERLEQEFYDDPCAAELEEDATDEQITARAQEVAERELIGPTSEVMELYLRLNKPFVIDAAGLTDRPVFDHSYDQDDAIAEVADDHGLTVEEIQEDFDAYHDEIYEKIDASWDEVHETIFQGIMQTAINLDCSAPSMPVIEDLLMDVTCNTFERSFKDSDEIIYLDNEEGDLINGSFFAGLLQHLGYDSIVLLNADKRFRTMNMMPATTHIHLMGSASKQIKSVQNCGAFDPDNPVIFA